MQPLAPTNRSCRRAGRAALLALVLVALGDLPARADVGSERRPKSLLSLGPSFEIAIDGSMRFGGELALAQYSGRSGFGAAAGFVSGRIYLELQPAWVLGGKTHNVVLGLNPGGVIDVTRNVPCYGGQVTLWANYARGAPRLWALPVFPFVRVQAVAWLGFTVTGGLMLKLPLPIS